jgi:tetratricopeptide (TPR) repeat protein
MNKCKWISRFLVLAVVAGAVFGCSKPADDGKIPITTKSDEARKEYLLGRDLLDGQRVHEATPHFDRAIAVDPGFCGAELARAMVSTGTAEFLDHLKKAVALSGSVSEGERLVVLAAEAGSTGDVAKRKELLDKLVAAYPKDERVHDLLGNHYNNVQEFAGAAAEFKTATELSPAYAPAYNSLGYADRSLGKYSEAEQAFKKYIELVPGDPNPYDSYAELLLKEGKFDQSIDNYKMALAKDPNFISSKVGIAFDHLYMGKPDQAEADLHEILASARDEGERGGAWFDMVVLHIDGGKTDLALQDCDSLYAIAERHNDVSDMAGTLGLKGDVLEEAGKYAEAKETYERVMKTIESSNLPAERKENSVRTNHFRAATLALAAKNLNDARTHAGELEKLVAARPNPARVRGVHELNGRIALGAKEYDRAIEELQKANLEDSYNLYRLALAYSGKGDAAKAKEYCARAAHFYPLPDVNYAFIRLKAEKMLAGMK